MSSNIAFLGGLHTLTQSSSSPIVLVPQNKPLRPHRLTVRTPGFHPGNRGSIPLGATKTTSSSEGVVFIMK